MIDYCNIYESNNVPILVCRLAYIRKVVNKSLLNMSLKVIEKSLFKVIGSHYLRSHYLGNYFVSECQLQIVGESALLLSIRHLRVCQQIVGESEKYLANHVFECFLK